MFAFGVLVLHLATAGAQPAPHPPPPAGKPPPPQPPGKQQAQHHRRPQPTEAPVSKARSRAKIKDLLPKPKIRPHGRERPPHMQGPGRNPRYDTRGYRSDLVRKQKGVTSLQQKLQQRQLQQQQQQLQQQKLQTQHRQLQQLRQPMTHGTAWHWQRSWQEQQEREC